MRRRPIGDRDVIVFASEGFDRREILPVGGKKEMRPFALVFLAHQRPPGCRRCSERVPRRSARGGGQTPQHVAMAHSRARS